ncbi:hypothetical protein [Pedobacter frigidisoli]|uniref:hypothetical protein n=1 Tax=Pedobacter frigidisoli TaxID=2530455 RepID=UPI0013F167CF|nr:hypothetical protein [Pedobacter frigidisoli]
MQTLKILCLISWSAMAVFQLKFVPAFPPADEESASVQSGLANNGVASNSVTK